MYLSPSLSSGQVAEIQQASLVEDSRQADQAKRGDAPSLDVGSSKSPAPEPATASLPEASHLGRWLNAKA